MTQRYYRITGAEALAAVQQYEADRNQLRRAARVFAAHFGGTPVYSSSIGETIFHGLRFSPEKPRDLRTPEEIAEWQMSDEYVEQQRLIQKWNNMENERNARHSGGGELNGG